ncbi:MAG: hypothetical protein OXC63_05165 [Aestuariivita sp.]|nr:hypothetical protein [Aestuariivita sp.]MCY4346926.1 hypothetical protein [Aestuariivita sp.]
MNLDGAQNAQVGILKDLFQFQENRAYGDGPRAYVDPESEEFTEIQDPTEIMIVTTQADITSPRGVRSRLESTMSKPANNIAIGVSASDNSSENHYLLAIYQDHNLKHGGLLSQLDDRYGNEIRIIYSGRPRTFPAWHKQAANPLRPGASLGHPKISAGTLGGFVKERGKSGRLGVLSNNHVLANGNAAQIGDKIYQPGSIDGGTNAHVVATLVAYKQIFFGGIPNTTDCA